MSRERQSLFADPVSLDVTGFAPKPKPAQPQVSRDELARVANESGFESREPVKRSAPAKPKAAEPHAPRPVGRRRRGQTGRTDQLNIKCSAAEKDRFYELAEGFPSLGEALVRAMDALERELKANSKN